MQYKRPKYYSIWYNMKVRCYNPKHAFYKYYGGRGIGMKSSWRDDYQSFEKDIDTKIGHRPTLNHTIDRINNNKGYSINNIKWSTREEQFNNRSNNVVFYGKTLSQRAKHLGQKRDTFHRIYKKKGIDGAIDFYKQQAIHKTYNGKTLSDIANEFGVSTSSTSYWHAEKGKSLEWIYKYYKSMNTV